MILLWFMRFKRKKKQKPVRTLLLPGFSGIQAGMDGLSYADQVDFDWGPEHFYMNSLSPPAETVCDFRHPIDNLNVLYNIDMQRFLAKGQVSNHCEFLIADPSSEDEDAFRSVCESLNSSRRFSNVSDTTSSFPSHPSSPLDLPNRRNSKLGEAYMSSSPSRPMPHDATRPVSPEKSNPSSSSSAASVIHPSDVPTLSTHNDSQPLCLPPPPPPRLPMPPRVPPPPLLKVPTPPQNRLSVTTPTQQSSSSVQGANHLPKLKPLHWDKVRAATDRPTVWDKLRAGSFEFDEETIESLFGYKSQTSMLSEDARTKSCSPSINILDPKRLQNITILSKAINSPAEQVCSALMQGNGLSVEQLEALAKMEPTNEEREKFSNFTGDPNELGLGERFLKEILNLPLAFVRVQAMLYKETFEDDVLHLKKSFTMIEDACKELKSSHLFLKLLAAVLKTGNRMNDGTTRGGAKAFRIDALLKLADVKGADGKTTLLHFVVHEMIRLEAVRASECGEEKDDEPSRPEISEERTGCRKRTSLDLVSDLGKELRNVKKASGVDLDALENSVSKLSEGRVMLSKLIEDDEIHGREVNFVAVMKHFLNHAHDEIRSLEQEQERVRHMVRRITQYFHGDTGKDEAIPLRIFVTVSDFLNTLDHVCKEIKSLKMRMSRKIPIRPENLSLQFGGIP